MFQISQLNQGTGNFNYTVDSHVKPYCPFFPGSYGSADHDWPRVSIATENGDDLVRILDAEEKSMEDVSAFFNSQFQHIEEIVQEAVNSLNSMSGVYVEYKGLDTSFNPGWLLLLLASSDSQASRRRPRWSTRSSSTTATATTRSSGSETAGA